MTTTRKAAQASPPKMAASTQEGEGPWTRAEHERFLAASKMHPLGPWKVIAAHVGTRNVRQTQTHAQKYKEKLARWNRGLSRRRKISFDSEDGHRPKYIERPDKKSAKRKTARRRKTHDKADVVQVDDLEPLAFTSQNPFKALVDTSPSPCQVDSLPSLGESLDYFMEMFDLLHE
ncbi:hypothetical protein H310_06068 [Aphanomyces invadans]|uniref:Uncharacterized protein n=1 Tax=Aphanomyces invadans TaxID=157072 RepID=A0A024UAF0_9STRA|nr:hypothetical protein H310_06068 [Aphanomyces invadans]ETW02598.1 hypothetical protein H310_06068 [Aphanomyces invadans]|eukprot:XP_008869203.1 hypothetical protein H310_06068 [Aphanomyces invadans]